MKTPLTILHVEDNPGDERLLRESIDGIEAEIELRVASDGQGAIDILLTDDTPAFIPDLILLDCHLPGITGKQVLDRIKTHTQLRRIPVVVFSDDDSAGTVGSMYDAYANAYVTKPESLDEYERVVVCLGRFWGEVSELPPVEPDP